MFDPDTMLFTLILIAMTAFGTYIIIRDKYYKAGLEAGAELAVDSLIEDGFVETRIDKNGDESLVKIEDIKNRTLKEAVVDAHRNNI
jgi:hypothetical protein